MLNNILLAINITLMYSAPLIFSALGGVITQRSGVDNIGIEGMMTFGAFAAAAVGYFTSNPWLGFLAGGLAGAALAVFHAVAAIHLQANQTISGVAMNFIGPGLALFLSRMFFEGPKTFNPLFLYGPSSVGKTHLTNAIGTRIKELYPEKRVLYVSAHLFQVQYKMCIRDRLYPCAQQLLRGCYRLVRTPSQLDD